MSDAANRSPQTQQVLDELRSLLPEFLGADRGFERQTRIDEYLKAEVFWGELDLTDLAYLLERHFNFRCRDEDWERFLRGHASGPQQWESEIGPHLTFGALADFITHCLSGRAPNEFCLPLQCPLPAEAAEPAPMGSPSADADSTIAPAKVSAESESSGVAVKTSTRLRVAGTPIVFEPVAARTAGQSRISERFFQPPLGQGPESDERCCDPPSDDRPSDSLLEMLWHRMVWLTQDQLPPLRSNQLSRLMQIIWATAACLAVVGLWLGLVAVTGQLVVRIAGVEQGRELLAGLARWAFYLVLPVLPLSLLTPIMRRLDARLRIDDNSWRGLFRAFRSSRRHPADSAPQIKS